MTIKHIYFPNSHYSNAKKYFVIIVMNIVNSHSNKNIFNYNNKNVEEKCA